MPIVFTQDMPGATKDLIQEVTAELHIDLDRPRGLIAHAACEIPGGVRIVDIWESEGDFHAFEGERLEPAMALVAARHHLDLEAMPVPRQSFAESFDTIR